MAPKQWMFDPNSGGIKIPPAVQADVKKRIQAVAEKEFKDKYTVLIFVLKTNSVTLTRTQSLCSLRAGLHQIGLKPVQNRRNDCEIRPSTYVDCGILGVLVRALG